MLAKDSTVINYLDTKNLPLPSPLLISIKDFSDLLNIPPSSIEVISLTSSLLFVSTSLGPSSTS